MSAIELYNAPQSSEPYRFANRPQVEARRRRAEGETLAELARSYHVGISTIRREPHDPHRTAPRRNPEVVGQKQRQVASQAGKPKTITAQATTVQPKGTSPGKDRLDTELLTQSPRLAADPTTVRS
jgi:hypothetical protein